MSEGAAESQGTQQELPVAQDGGGLNPAWNDLLGIVPQELHSQVTPHLSNWDKNFQSKINEVHSQYEPYKPFVEKKVDPDQINYALELLDATNTRPMEVIKALSDWAKQQGMWVDEQQGQVDNANEEIPSEFLNHPEFKQLQQMVQTIAQSLVQQNQSQQQAAEDAKIEAELEALAQKHGDFFDRDYVLSKALQNPDEPLSKHAQAYEDLIKSQLARQNQIPPGPRVMGPGGGAPSNKVDVSKLDGKGRRALVAQMVQDSLSQSQ